MDASFHVLVLLMYLHCAAGFCLKILPDSLDKIYVELGTDFTATCYLQEDSHYTSDDIEWKLDNNSLPKHDYHKINATAVSVTFTVSRDMRGRLTCFASKKSLSYEKPCLYGIFLEKGHLPSKPENLTCLALQEDDNFSPNLQCYWNPETRDPLLNTTYTLHAEIEYDFVQPKLPSYENVCIERLASNCTVNLSTFPVHMRLKVWVTVSNPLGSVESDVLLREALSFAKPNPPDVQVLADVIYSTVMVEWKHHVHESVMELRYVIRYCQAGSSVWTEVPEDFTEISNESFRLQALQPYTVYHVQMRCIQKDHQSYWSDWSRNATNRTAEAKPASKPDLWRIIQSTGDSRNVTLIWKAPVKANGVILRYDLKITMKNDSRFKEVIITSVDHNPHRSYQTYSVELSARKIASIEITAASSAGVSPKATLFIPLSNQDPSGVERVSWSLRDGQLWVEWMPPVSNDLRLSEYLLEWEKIPPDDHQRHKHWQRAKANVTSTTLTGHFEPFKQYDISVYPIYSLHPQKYTQAGRPVTTAAYTQQGPPLEGPAAKVQKSKKTSAKVTWNEIPLNSQHGFITNYTIFYKTGNVEKSVTVDSDFRSWDLINLTSESEYVVHIMASTIAGSKNGTGFNFKTQKYADGEVEVIVVVVCLGFLFITVFIIMLCLRKRETIKQLLWPQVPDPSVSSIAHWSPDFPIKADIPKEDVSVVEVDVFDGKSLCDEDKAVLPLKKDKYLSEEHSSGIGGSSCMSSPRHSVSDSDEGDSGQTTASTVQYSSVVASGYKGQTPNHHPPVFARSESTQPLLDCEEHPEHLHDSSNSYFRRAKGVELGGLVQEAEESNESSLTFCPMEEMSPIVEDPPTPCYMSQQNGYRPQ
ncbi:interleukin-6 receptor subunit beta [Triplophysa rosa]|uniref:Interleukin-6 receptor subunit beta n=1 Tax=Triplophysa rosa TaxID=992332 RepID=A0A9W7W9Y0_TRIRA|nr:interleukin-6 receptor subunit beta [Triplophysa rosa]KAI7793007.1 putative interleukin-6 receptor subunit beta [Triplophysa rosa]